MSIKVVLVDDHALVRTGFRMILGREVDIEVVGEADSGEDALQQIRRLKPDVVLCDLNLPGISGLEVIERIARADFGTRVIAVTVLEDGPMPKRALEAGASGYVGKACEAAELLRAVRFAEVVVVLLDVGIHDLDFVDWAFGPVTRVFTMRSQPDADGRNEYALVVARTADNSQLEGNCTVAIGTLSVWPSMVMGKSESASTSATAPSARLDSCCKRACPGANSTLSLISIVTPRLVSSRRTLP